jgi:hypothetical protein
MAKTLFIVDDDVFQGLPGAVQKSLLDETRRLFSFVPGFKVEARKPPLFPAIIHFTDSVVMLAGNDDEVDAAIRQISRREDANIRFSIKLRASGVTRTLRTLTVPTRRTSTLKSIGLISTGAVPLSTLNYVRANSPPRSHERGLFQKPQVNRARNLLIPCSRSKLCESFQRELFKILTRLRPASPKPRANFARRTQL